MPSSFEEPTLAPISLHCLDDPPAARTRRNCLGRIPPQTRPRELPTQLRFPRNQTIFNEGDPCTHFYMVVGGTARICKYLPDGRRAVMTFVFTGDFFGLSLLAPYGNAAEAASDLIVLRYPQSRFICLKDKITTFHKHLIDLLFQHLSAMQKHALLLGQRTAQERVACFIVFLFESLSRKIAEPFEVPMSRQDIADYLGLTVETVCREIACLKRMGAIALPSAHCMRVRNIGTLRSLTKDF